MNEFAKQLVSSFKNSFIFGFGMLFGNHNACAHTILSNHSTFFTYLGSQLQMGKRLYRFFFEQALPIFAWSHVLIDERLQHVSSSSLVTVTTKKRRKEMNKMIYKKRSVLPKSLTFFLSLAFKQNRNQNQLRTKYFIGGVCFLTTIIIIANSYVIWLAIWNETCFGMFKKIGNNSLSCGHHYLDYKLFTLVWRKKNV